MRLVGHLHLPFIESNHLFFGLMRSNIYTTFEQTMAIRCITVFEYVYHFYFKVQGKQIYICFCVIIFKWYLKYLCDLSDKLFFVPEYKSICVHLHFVAYKSCLYIQVSYLFAFSTKKGGETMIFFAALGFSIYFFGVFTF